MLALRRARLAASPPFLRGGFRPFFFLGASWAVIALGLWMLAYSGNLVLPSAFEPLSWHRHEMLFGFVGAVIAGFLLTAIPNWTGRLPIAGWPLACLVGLWAAARLSLLFSAWTGMVAAAIIDVGFYFVLAGLAAREVTLANNRNLPPVAMVFLMGVANAADHAGAAKLVPDADVGIRAALSIVVMLISLIGGRIIPSFTRNWMTKQGITLRLPTQPTRFDLAVLVTTGLGLLAWITAPSAVATGGLLIAAAFAQALRLSRWGGLRSVPDPLVLILHIGYVWVPVGLLLLGANILGTTVPRSAAIHALTAGAMATMIVAVMTRVILGHTGRALNASPLTVLIYGLITLGAVLRVAASLGMLDYTLGMEVAAGTWAGAFALFLAIYGPILFRPRLGTD
ncbi:MAG: NnrS family protein [Rhizobiales bacterium]|nr:NnrS family protein [Hyphomicrobiales bacterium]